MKKTILGLFLVILLVTAVAAPVFAADIDVGTGVIISAEGGSAPVIKCKWEEEPVANMETGDESHSVNGTQILPPLVKCNTKPIQYYAVVTDEEEQGNIAQVWADVFHPEGSPPPYSTSSDPRGPLFKYEIPFTKKGHSSTQINWVQDAYDAGLITFSDEYDIDDVIFELQKGTADVWMGQKEIDYEQPAGDYLVSVGAVDHGNNPAVALNNTFEYVPTCGIEVDFTSISYGPVSLDIEKMVPGDTDFADPAAPAGYNQSNMATVRNIGNTWASVTVWQDDMGFGKDGTGMWNVSYDARMGNDDAYYVQYDPEEDVTLDNALGLSQKEELDFSIKVHKGFGAHNGTMVLGCMIRDFVDPVPEWVVGVDDPCPES